MQAKCQPGGHAIALAGTLLLCLTGCFNPDYGETGFRCEKGSCPGGYTCQGPPGARLCVRDRVKPRSDSTAIFDQGSRPDQSSSLDRPGTTDGRRLEQRVSDRAKPLDKPRSDTTICGPCPKCTDKPTWNGCGFCPQNCPAPCCGIDCCAAGLKCVNATCVACTGYGGLCLTEGECCPGLACVGLKCDCYPPGYLPCPADPNLCCSKKCSPDGKFCA